MTLDWRTHWNQRHSDNDVMPLPAEVLREYTHLLPASGRALDLACGVGVNALLLAERGLETYAWDIADVAIEKLLAEAQRCQLDLHAEVRDLREAPPLPESFDVIVCQRFLLRELAPAIKAALRPRGLLFYQTFVQEKVADTGPKTPEFLLAPNELLHLFAELHLLVYREEGRVGNLAQGFRNQAMLIAERR